MTSSQLAGRLWLHLFQVSIFLLSQVAIPSAFAQNMLDILLGQGNPESKMDIKTPETSQIRDAQTRIKQLALLTNTLRKRLKERTQEWEKDTKLCRELIAKHQIKLGYSDWRSDPFIVKLRLKLLSVAEQCVFSIEQLQAVYDARDQNIQTLRDVINNYLKTRSTLANFIQKYYINTKNLGQLEQDLQKMHHALRHHQKSLTHSKQQSQNFIKEQEKNKKDVEIARKRLLSIQQIVPTKQQPVAPPVSRKQEPIAPATSRRVASTSVTQTTTRPSPTVVKHVPAAAVSPTEQEILQMQKQSYIHKISQSIHHQRFHVVGMRSRWLRVRIRDEAIEQEIGTWNIRMYEYSIKAMQSAQKRLLAYSRTGLWFRQPFTVHQQMWKEIGSYSALVVERSPQVIKTVGQRLMNNWRSLDQWPTIFSLILSILLIVILFVLTRTTRFRLAQSMTTLAEKAESASVTRMFWLSLQLVFRSIYDLLPYLGGLIVVGVLSWILELPYEWQAMLWSLGFILLGFRAIGTLAWLLFGPQQEHRFFRSLDNHAAWRFRRIIHIFRYFSLFYLPVVQVASLFGYSEPFVHLLKVIFYGFLVFCLSLLLLNQEDILNLLPTDSVMGRTVLVLVYRLYPIFFLFTLGFFGIYVWGYVNFVSYFIRNLVLSVLILGLAYALYHLFWTAGLVVFGLSRDSISLIHVEKKLAHNFLRLGRFVFGIILIVFAVSLFLGVWGIAGGFSTILQLINYPFLQIKDTQLTAVSLFKFAISLILALYLSRLVRENMDRYVYPALQLSLSNQHATNTVLDYSILFMGLLFGLQWMGLGIGVLTVFAGVVGIGVGFGLQNIASNFISGLIITFGKPIKVGDFIEVGGLLGEVKEISARSTTVETQDYRIVLIPNSEILTTKVINWSMGRPFILVNVAVGVAYGSDVPLVMKTLLESGLSHPKVLKDPKPSLRFESFGANSLDFSLRVAIGDPLQRFDVLSDLRIDIDQRFREQQISIAFPQHDIHFDQELQEAVVHALHHLPASMMPQHPHLSTTTTKGTEK